MEEVVELEQDYMGQEQEYYRQLEIDVSAKAIRYTIHTWLVILFMPIC